MAHSEWVSVALAIHHAMRMSLIVNCGLPGCTIFFILFSKKVTIFEKNKEVIEHKICVLIFSTTSDRNILHSKKN